MVNTGGSRVAVVGGGMSGLAAAFRLKEAGYSPVVFEAEQHPGGRSLSTVHGGYTIDRGAGILSSQYSHLLGLLADAGLGHLVVPANGVFGFARDDGGVTQFDGSHQLRDALRFPLSLGSKLVATRLLADVVRHRRGLLAQDLDLAAQLDRESAADYSRRRLNTELLHTLVDPTVRGLAGTAADDASVFDFLVALCKFLGASSLAARDGMGSFAQELSSRHEMEYGARVSSVRDRDGAVDVSWATDGGTTHTDRFAGCIIALPAPAVPPIYPDLDRWRADFLASIRYTSAVCVHLGVRERPAHLTAALVVFPEAVEPGIMAMGLEHLKVPGRAPADKGLITLVTDDAGARAFADCDDSAVVSVMAGRAERFVPGISKCIELAEVTRWDRVVVRARPGHYVSLREFVDRSRADSSIRLAGDYVGVGSIDTAVGSGERAAAALTDWLGGNRSDPLPKTTTATG